MMISKRRMVHALSYEIILLIIIAIALSFIFEVPMEVTGTLGVAMAVTSVIWNMIFLCTRQISQNPYPIRILPS